MLNEHLQIKADQFQQIGPNKPPPARGYAYNGPDYSELFEDGERVALVEEVRPNGRYVDLAVIDWRGCPDCRGTSVVVLTG
jgi:hypothetical protein